MESRVSSRHGLSRGQAAVGATLVIALLRLPLLAVLLRLPLVVAPHPRSSARSITRILFQRPVRKRK